MGDEFYAIIKLVSGEEILSLVSIDENDGDPLVVMQNPITMKVLRSHHGMHIKVKSWIEMSSDDFFIVKPDKMITITETKDKRLIEIYNNYIEDEDLMNAFQSPTISENQNTSGKVKPSQKMGYIATVEEARKRLEDIFKLEDPKES
jgi:hypothetical protein